MNRILLLVLAAAAPWWDVSYLPPTITIEVGHCTITGITALQFQPGRIVVDGAFGCDRIFVDGFEGDGNG